MLIDRYPAEDVFARVPELANQTDPVLVQLDHLLDDDALYQQVRADLAHRYRLTPVHGRHSTPGEVLLRLLVVQHLYAWSYAETVERVADSLVLRWFVRVYFQRVPDATTLLRWAHTIRPETLHALNDRVAVLARQAKVTQARKLRLDSTCVQTPIHHPTDSGLLGDSVRVLTRLVRRARPLVEETVKQEVKNVQAVFRSRMRSVRRTLQLLHRVRRQQGEEAAETQRALYERLLSATRQTVCQAKRVRDALRRQRPAPPTPLAAGLREQQPAVEPRPSPEQRRAARLHAQFEHVLPLVEQVIAQAQRRVIDGASRALG